MAGSDTGASMANIQHGFASVFYQKEQLYLKINNEEVFAALFEGDAKNKTEEF